MIPSEQFLDLISLDQIGNFRPNAYKGNAPEPRYIVDRRIPHGVAMLIAGAGGVGKSFLKLDCIEAISGGCSRAFGGDIVTKGAPCIGVFSEDDRDEIDRRLRTIRQHRNITPSEHGLILPTINVEADMTLFRFDAVQACVETTQAYAWLERVAAATIAQCGELGLVVLDNLSTLAAIDANRAEQVQPIWHALNRFAAKFDCTVAVLHHLRKDSSGDIRNAIRGSSALVDGCRAAYVLHILDPTTAAPIIEASNLDKGTEIVRLELVKANGAMLRAPVTYWRAVDGYLHEMRGLNVLTVEEALLEVVRTSPVPLKKSGKNGLHEARNSTWPAILQGLGRDKLIRAANDALAHKRLVISSKGILGVPPDDH